MTKQEIETLAKLLHKHSNNTDSKHCSFYGATMDKALCKDTISTLFRYPEADKNKLNELLFSC